MSKQPILPKKEKTWSEDANAYRQNLHENVYPKNVDWTPVKGNVTADMVQAEYVRVARLWSFSIVFFATTATSGAYVDLPVAAEQYSVFSVSIGGTASVAVIDKGSSRLYLPTWGATGRVVISGVIVN